MTRSSEALSEFVVSLRGVDKSYVEAGGAKRSVLQSVDLDIRRGEFVVLLGRSGSGKSTLLHLIAGLDFADRGEIHVAGRELGSLSDRERTLLRREKIGVVFQAFNLIPTLDVLENVTLRPELNRTGVSGARSRATELLERVGLADRIHTPPDQLSGGEQQRVAIAAALAHDPDLVLADEPTGNLDAETGHRVVELLDRIVKERGKTLVMATHSPEMVGIADRILRIEQGTIVEDEGS